MFIYIVVIKCIVYLYVSIYIMFRFLKFINELVKLRKEMIIFVDF